MSIRDLIQPLIKCSSVQICKFVTFYLEKHSVFFVVKFILKCVKLPRISVVSAIYVAINYLGIIQNAFVIVNELRLVNAI